MKVQIPRGAVVVLCAIPFLVPAAISLGAFTFSNYVQSGSNVNHRDADSYKTYINISNDSALYDKINDARSDWNTSLGTAGATVDVPISSNGTGAQITFVKANLSDANIKVKIDNPYHQPGTVTYNTYNNILANMSNSDRRARACRAIGTLMGIDPKSNYTDCMDSDSTANNSVGSNSIQIAKDFYDPQIDISGQLVTWPHDIVHHQSYTFNATASGHDLQSMTVTFKRLQTLTSTSTTTQSTSTVTSCTVVNSRCQLTYNTPVDLTALEPGRYRIDVVATNSHGDSKAQTLDYSLDFPYFGFNDFWSRSDYLNRSPHNLANDPYWGAEQVGANSARIDASQGNYVDCTTGTVVADPSDTLDTTKAYLRMISDGVRPVIVLYPSCNPARSAATGGCSRVDYSNVDAPGAPADTSADNAVWQAAAAEVAHRYPDALGIEISNEPNTTRFWGGCEFDSARYEELLDLAYQGVNGTSGDPDVQVVIAGMAPGPSKTEPKEADPPATPPPGNFTSRADWEDVLGDLSDLGADGSSDALGIHPYRPTAECSTYSFSDSAAHQIDLAQDRSSSGWPGLPTAVWVTEVGISTAGDSTQDCRHAPEAWQYLGLNSIDSVIKDAHIPVEIFHSYRDYAAYDAAGSDTAGWENGTGIVYADRSGDGAQFTKKTAYCGVMDMRSYSRSPC